MSLLEETIEKLQADLDWPIGINAENLADCVLIDWKTVEDAIALLKGKSATWVYTTNDENRARWKCSACGKLCKRRPTDKRFCSHCGAAMKFQA